MGEVSVSELSTAENPRNILEKLGGHVVPVATVPATVSLDRESFRYVFGGILPFAGGDIYHPETMRALVRLVTRGNDPSPDKANYFLKTETSGRANYFWPMLFEVRDGWNTVMSAVMVKGAGSLDSIRECGSPFDDFGGTKKEEIRGAATIKDLRLDAENSRRLSEGGVRTRVCLGVFLLEKVPYCGKDYTPSELMSSGLVKKEEDLPGVGIFASRTALRIGEVHRILVNNDINSLATEALIRYLIATTTHDNEKEFAEFYGKYESKSVKGAQIAPKERREILSDFSMALFAVLGRQAARFEKLRAIKKYRNSLGEDEVTETDHNVTCLGESADNSEVFFGANATEISSYQFRLFELGKPLVKCIDDVGNTEWEQRQEELINNSMTVFLEGYLDEMRPYWRTSLIPEDFISTQVQKLGLGEDDIRRAYWLTKVKIEEGSIETGGEKLKKEDLYDIASNFFPYQFHRNTGEFISDCYDRCQL